MSIFIWKFFKATKLLVENMIFLIGNIICDLMILDNLLPAFSLANTRLNTISHREDNRIDFVMASYCLSALVSFFFPNSVTRQTSSPRAWRCACISTFHHGKPVPSKNGALSVLIPSPDMILTRRWSRRVSYELSHKFTNGIGILIRGVRPGSDTNCKDHRGIRS